MHTLHRATCSAWFACACAIGALLVRHDKAHAAMPIDTCSSQEVGCAPVGRWNLSITLGAGMRSNPLAHSAALPLLVLPELSYYGNRIFVHNLDLGVTLAAGRGHSLSLVASPSYDRAFFYRSDLQNFLVSGSANAVQSGTCHCSLVPVGSQAALHGVATNRPHLLYLAGPEWTADLGAWSVQLDLLQDVTGTTGGTEVRGAVALPVYARGFNIDLHLGFTWKGAALVDYYYGVPPYYHPRAAFNPFIKIGMDRPLSRHWTLRAFVDGEWLGTSIADSPLVDKHYVVTGFAGATYAF